MFTIEHKTTTHDYYVMNTIQKETEKEKECENERPKNVKEKECVCESESEGWKKVFLDKCIFMGKALKKL